MLKQVKVSPCDQVQVRTCILREEILLNVSIVRGNLVQLNIRDSLPSFTNISFQSPASLLVVKKRKKGKETEFCFQFSFLTVSNCEPRQKKG